MQNAAEKISLLEQELAESRAALADSHSELRATQNALRSREQEIEHLKLQLAKLRRQQFGRRSEQLDAEIEQLQLKLDTLQQQPATGASSPKPSRKTAKQHPTRQILPDHLSRQERRHEPEMFCPDCGDCKLSYLGEDHSETLEYIPGRFVVVRDVRPKYSCTTCQHIVQQPAPSKPIERGLAGPGLLSHVLVSKYADHLPLYRQSEIYARENVHVSRATMSGWVEKCHELLQPLAAAVGRYVTDTRKIHADDTNVSVLAPGNGKTKTGRLWTYVRDDRPAGSADPPAVWFQYSPSRHGKYPRSHLADFTGTMQCDAFAGYNGLFERSDNPILEVSCWAHARRKFYEIHQANGSPVANEAVEKIAVLYALEKEIRGKPPDERLAARQTHAAPRLAELKCWLEATYETVSKKGGLAGAIQYALKRWDQLSHYVNDGLFEIDNNAAERSLRTVALGRKNYLFAGSDEGGKRAASIYTLLGTAKLNGIEPEAYLSYVLSRIADHPINRVDELLPWRLADELEALESRTATD